MALVFDNADAQKRVVRENGYDVLFSLIKEQNKPLSLAAISLIALVTVKNHDNLSVFMKHPSRMLLPQVRKLIKESRPPVPV